VFQSPSLRGSGRFPKLQRSLPNLLAQVSIPFIAGQWSLLVNRGFTSLKRRKVSIPFIAGQWSLPGSSFAFSVLNVQYVSIPFIAGQWSLRNRNNPNNRVSAARFNPLHCGAVVASRSRKRRPARRQSKFQSPSLRGSGRFRRGAGALRRQRRVSIPFIAGQWSLHLPTSPRPEHPPCFNPLHCGAVVASRRARRAAAARPSRVSIPFIAGQWSLLERADEPTIVRALVSIPFIAGQWSLRLG